MNIKQIYNRAIQNGTHTGNKNELNKRIKLVNVLCLLWYLAFVLTSVLTIIFRGIDSPILKVNVIGFCVITICQFLNRSNKYSHAAFGVLLYTIFHYTFLSCFISPERFVEFFFVFVPCISLLFFNNYKFSWIIFFLSIIAFNIPFLVFDYYKSETILFLPPLMLLLFVVNFLIVLYFKKLNLENEHLLTIERDTVLTDKLILEKQQRELKELNAFKSHFFVNLSHEIRTPLTLIQGYASRINLNDSREKSQAEIDIINSQAEHIQSIINNILDLSKMDAKEFSLNTTLVDLTYFLNKHFGNFKGLFDAKEIHFLLKNKTQNTGIEVDEDLFSKSINNLLSNALKFTPQGGKVILEAIIEKENLNLKIIDTGIGIVKEDQEKIFDRFYQSKNDITKSQGSGIGLSFTKSIVENHGFTIHVESIPNIKTSFSIRIPKEAFQEADSFKNLEIIETPSVEYEEKNSVKSSKNKIGRKILVVDDHEQMRSYINNVLDEYQITEAENGREALEKMKVEDFDLIITDYMMPVMDGEEFVNEVKNQNLKTPIIVLTARTDNSGKLTMLRLGIDGYLHKPFQEEELLIHVKKSLKSYELINQFDSQLEQEEKQSLNEYSQKFNSDLRDYISNNLTSNNFSVDDISEHFNVSKSTLNRKVKSLLGQTTQQAIMEVRFEKARELKRENPFETQKKIARSIGVVNTSYFFKKMEERFGKL